MPLPKQAAKVNIIFNYTKSDNDSIMNKFLLYLYKLFDKISLMPKKKSYKI